ncbi:MAG: YraN family protein [Desulfovibrionales bacterium]|nr:YraN family protein [Desulfovibrionales bacterium]
MPARHLITGQTGEDLAAAFLTEKGLRVRQRNFRCRGGEIDLICEDRGTVVFVEVKTRSGAVRGEPGEAVCAAKQERLIRAASLYLSHIKAWDRPCRFDLVSVVMHAADAAIEHWEDIIDVRDGLGRGHAPWQPW